MNQKPVFLFPGQGSQYVGMGKNFFESDFADLAKKFYERASEVLSYDVAKTCHEGPENLLTQTEKTQPLILTHGIICYEILKSQGIEPSIVLGHSVGEYTALTAAGIWSFEEGVKATYLRGKSMQEAAPLGTGSMYAIMRVPQTLIEEACTTTSSKLNKVVTCANYNTPEQIVISGDKEACEQAVRYIEEKHDGRMRAVELRVSAPFHSPLMKPAERTMESFFKEVNIKPPKIPYIANIDAQVHEKASSITIQENLLKQVCGAVRWVESIAAIQEKTQIIELGPSKVLTGLVKKINKNLRVFSFEEESDLTKVIKDLNDFLGV